MNDDFVCLTTEKQIRIFMFPLRQKILKLMYQTGKPMTAKQISDQLAISPSSAKHHLLKLEEILLVSLDHKKLINGITAKYYRATGKNVSIGQIYDDDYSAERDAYVKNQLNEAYDEYQALVLAKRQNKSTDFVGDLMTGIIHITEEQAREMHEMLLKYMQENRDADIETSPWHFTILAYNAALICNE